MPFRVETKFLLADDNIRPISKSVTTLKCILSHNYLSLIRILPSESSDISSYWFSDSLQWNLVFMGWRIFLFTWYFVCFWSKMFL